MPLSSSAVALLDRLELERDLTHTPNVSRSTGMFLYEYVVQHGYKHILELGTANGASSVYFLEAIQNFSDGHLLSIEISRRDYERARSNLSAYTDHCTLVCANATEFLQSTGDMDFDCIFIDAGKALTLTHYLLARKRLRSKWTIIVDDVVKFSSKMQDFYAYLREHAIPYRIEMTDMDDGIMILE